MAKRKDSEDPRWQVPFYTPRSVVKRLDAVRAAMTTEDGRPAYASRVAQINFYLWLGLQRDEPLVRERKGKR